MAGIGILGYVSSVGTIAGKLAISHRDLLSLVVMPVLCLFVSTGFLWFGVRVMRGCMGRASRSHPKPVSGHDFSRAVQRKRESASRPTARFRYRSMRSLISGARRMGGTKYRTKLSIGSSGSRSLMYWRAQRMTKMIAKTVLAYGCGR